MPQTSTSSSGMKGVNSTSDLEKCADICLECYRICNETLSHCLEKGGTHVESRHLALLLDCATICQTSADFLTRGSEQHMKTCNVCADICAECAEDCRRLGDKEMNRCADVCEQCARSCRDMVTN